MKKVVSVLKDGKGVVKTISFRASGNKGGGGEGDNSLGKGGVVYLINAKGVLVNDDHANMIEERLGSQVAISDPKEQDVADQQDRDKAAEEAVKVQQGQACTTEDGQEGTYQPGEDGKLVCTIPTDEGDGSGGQA